IELIKEFYFENKRMPSYSEIASLFRWRSKNAVYKFIKKMESLGVIEKDKKGRLLPGKIEKTVKVLGTVEAGFPSPAEEELADMLSLDKWLISNPSSTFMLKISGDSMSHAGILPGDVVLVDRSITPKNGDIVIANVDGNWTIKYLRKKYSNSTGKSSTGFILEPANPKYSPIKPKKELTIGGVVIAVIRKYR
ncbi:MAG: repressor LexA, partial [Actinobacteria bacterium]|nr:repressor LexA [Actinomycetota bacterium]